MTKQTRQDLIDSKNMWKGIAISFILVYIILLLFLVIVNPFEQMDDLKQELQSCQENVEVWTLEVECDYDWKEYEKISYELILNDYNEYLSLIEELDDDYCEVIK